MTTPLPAQAMRIGELAARTGVSVHVLRVWERRYGLLAPSRSAGGYRLYGPQDEWRVRTTVRLREEGLPAAQAAAAALQASRGLSLPAAPDTGNGDGADPVAATAEGVTQLRERLLQAVGEFDGTAAQAILDVSLEHLGVEATIADVIMPLLHEAGDRWAAGEFTVAQEHFASHLIRSRLSSLTLAWDAGTGPLAVLACPSGERHDLGLLSFGVVLSRSGWRVRYLGADTPMATLGSAVEALAPDIVVLCGVREEPLRAAADHLDELTEGAAKAMAASQLVLAGAGATAEIADLLGATVLTGDPVESARRLAESRHPPAVSE